MKTLLFNGSPRPNGDTAQLLRLFAGALSGESKTVRAYDGGIKPCVDCRYCWEHPGCAVQDGMQEVYRWIQDCDNIVLGSPIYFSELTGQLLAVLSRLQALFCARFFRGEQAVLRGKKGAILLIGGGDGGMARAETTAKILLRQMGADTLFPVISFHDTNRRPAIEDAETLRRVLETAREMSDVKANRIGI